MNKYIAYCGLDCEKCEARIATANNDDNLREKVAKEWSELNKVTITKDMINCEGCRMDGKKTKVTITKDMINCEGCRMDGKKTPFCDSLCEIRKCAVNKNVETCGSCKDVKTCEKVGMIINNNEEALKNLK